jgi:carbon-monoxide dehydrogenase large subunit
MKLLHLTSPTTLNPLGVKGVGESGVIPIPAAVISAIEDALSPFGVSINSAPISPPELFELIAKSRAKPAVTPA